MWVPTTSRQIINFANSTIPIEGVLSKLFDIEAPQDAGGWKTFCPLGYDHSDGGKSKALRVYSESNSAWCFSHGMKFTPVELWKIKTGTASNLQAARDLLDYFNVDITPPTMEQRWMALEEGGLVDLDASEGGEAFLIFLQSLPDYCSRQYEPDVLDKVNTILGELNKLPVDLDYDMLKNWLEKSRGQMKTFWRNKFGTATKE